MSTLVKMIEALQSKMTGAIRSCYESDDCGDVVGTNEVDDWVDDCNTILAAARAQEQELAAMKEPMECGHPQAFLEMRCIGKHHMVTGEPIADSVCSLCWQHSSDLREIAEMAIQACEADYGVPEENASVTIDQVLAAFREKQQKSKGGDARESSKSSQPDQR